MRVLRNLHGVYSDGEDWERATRSADRLLKLSPNDPDALRDRGLGYLHMGHASGARTDLARYLHPHPDARDAMKVRARLGELGGAGRDKIGGASGRERGWEYVGIAGVAVL